MQVNVISSNFSFALSKCVKTCDSIKFSVATLSFKSFSCYEKRCKSFFFVPECFWGFEPP